MSILITTATMALFATILLGAIGLFGSLSSHPRWYWVWILVGVLGAVVGGGFMCVAPETEQQDLPMRKVPCEVLESRVDREDSDGTPSFKVYLRTRWAVDGKTYTMPKLTWFYHHQGRDVMRQWELQLQYRRGTTVTCFYNQFNPKRVHARDKSQRHQERWELSTSMLLAALVLIVFGLFKGYRPGTGNEEKRPAVWPALIRGFLLLLCVVGGFVLIDLGYRWGGWAMMAAGAALAIYGVWWEINVQAKVMTRLRRRLEPLSGQELQAETVDEQRWSPSEGEDVVEGLWHQCQVRAVLADGTLSAEVTFPRWPRRMSVVRRSASRGADPVTGDPEFDHELELRAEESVWRPLLIQPVRKRLVRVLLEQGAVLDPSTRTMHLNVSKRKLRRAEARLEQIVLLGRDLARVYSPDGAPQARVLKLALEEPLAGVRLGHYRWLMQEGWEIPRVLEQAAADSDAAIKRWAADNRVGGGLYR